MLDLRKKRILVMGGRGFIGSHLIDALERHGVLRENIFTPSSKECDLRILDDCIKTVKGVNVVFDCVANAKDLIVRRQIPADLFYENLIMGLNLIRAAQQEGVKKMITVGSILEYPEGAPMPLTEDNLWGGLPTGTSIPYGLSKRIVSLQGDLYRRQMGLNFIHVILTNTYGEGEKFSSGYMVPSLIQKIMKAKEVGEKEIEVWGTGRATRDLIYVDDVTDSIIRVAESYNKSLPLNIGSGIEISISEIIKLLCSIIGYKGSVHWDSSKPEGELRRFLDVRNAINSLGFKAKTPLDLGLKKTVDWHYRN